MSALVKPLPLRCALLVFPLLAVRSLKPVRIELDLLDDMSIVEVLRFAVEAAEFAFEFWRENDLKKLPKEP
jgi:hypothetical protein